MTRYSQARLIESIRLDGKDTKTLFTANLLRPIEVREGMLVVFSRRGQTFHVPLQNVSWLEPEPEIVTVQAQPEGVAAVGASKKKN